MNAPHLPAISMATAVCRSNRDGIARCGMSRATPEASHWATTCSVLPQRPPGQQQTKQQLKNVPKRLAILMAAVVCRYNTTCIAQQRRFRALLDATKRCYQASIAANSCNWSSLPWFFSSFFIINTKRSLVDTKAPVFNKGVTYQMKEKGLIKVSI